MSCSLYSHADYEHRETHERGAGILFVMSVADLDGWLGREATEEEINRSRKALDHITESTWDAFEEAFGTAACDKDDEDE